jgi:hypothetical protein|uniref:Uncharacterized protein n=1 Tax=viral metagenome TaxID=1070528 RepID=A0A6C0DNA7_9ZZZZ
MNKLYEISLKMLNDKHKISNYPYEKFETIYNKVFADKNEFNENDLNKQVLKKINEDYISSKQEPDINLVVKDYISKRENSKIIPYATELINNKNTINYINVDNNSTGRSFIINTFKNNVNFTKQILNKIYPSYLCIPSSIKNYTPYIILSINEDINYTFVPSKISNVWDIWKPVNDKYINIELNSSNWSISLFDHSNTLIDLQSFYIDILNIVDNNSYYELKLNHNSFNSNEKIKIFSKSGSTFDSIVLNKNNDIIVIQKNNIKLEQLFNAKICSYKYQISIIFKTFLK